MKAIVPIKRFLLLAALLTGCDRSTKPIFEQPSEPITTIAGLKALCTQTALHITQDIDLRAVVTANDWYGEFYKTLVIEDASGGISLSADGTALADTYPIGMELTVYCNGLWLGEYGGKIVLGAAPEGDYSVGRISSSELVRHLHPQSPATLQRQPTLLAPTDIGLQHADTYVRFDNVHFTQPGRAWCDLDPVTLQPLPTEHTIADAQGNTFLVRVIGSAEYAKEPVPQGTGSLCGIVDYFNGKFSLRITNHEVLF